MFIGDCRPHCHDHVMRGHTYKRCFFGVFLIILIFFFSYNNKTYKIDDINWDSNPKDTFNTRKGDVSFVEYYKTVSSNKIDDSNAKFL